MFKNASKISDSSISLPVGPHLLKKDLIFISENVLRLIKKFKWKSPQN